MTTPPPDPNTAVFPGFPRRRSPYFHLERGGGDGCRVMGVGWGGGGAGFHFPAARLTVSLRSATDKPIGHQRCQRAPHS